MRKFLSIAVGIALLAGSMVRPAAAAATASPTLYSVKFVCGRTAPLSVDFPAPNEPAVKPGNYATKINIELQTAGTEGTHVGYNISLANGGLSAEFFSPAPSRIFQTVDFTCQDIVSLAKQNGLTIPTGTTFIDGYFNIIADPGRQLAVTGVYTSQGLFILGPGVVAAPAAPQADIDVVTYPGVPFEP
jgi:hypothetical protein